MALVRAAALAVLMALGWLAPALAAPIEAYGRLPAIEQVAISPDGTMLAYVVTDGEKRAVVIRRTSDKSMVRGLNAGDTKVRDLRWAGSGHVLLTISVTTRAEGVLGRRREYFMVEDMDIATGRQRALMEKQAGAMNVVYGLPEVRIIDGTPIAFLHGIYFSDGSYGRLALFRINLKTGGSSIVESPLEDVDDWVIDASGEVIAQSEYDQKSGRWTLKLKTGRSWRTRDSRIVPTGSPSLYGLGRDSHAIVAGALNADGQPTYGEYSTGTETGAAAPLQDDFDTLIHDPVTQLLIGGSALVGDEERYTFFDPKTQSAWRTVAKAYAGNRVSLASWSDDRRKIVVRIDGADGPAFGLVDLDAKSAVWLAEIYGGLGPDGVAEQRAISYKAADGTEITGYLTLPKGRDPKGLPLVVLPHGGPAARDEPGFDWWAQALASRGYAVLQPNFRGSEGFGWKFMSAGFGQWGRKMQTDLSDGVRDLAAKGIIDPKRVCIVGGSYGGYAALAGATLDPGVYRCAVSVAGPADLRRFLQWGQQDFTSSQNSRLRYWTQFMGVDGIKDPDLADISPASHADAVSIPILLIHGRDDTVVPYEQSRIMETALKKAGKPVTLVTLDGEDHWLSRGATRLQMLNAVVAFLEANNPPR
ncbi:MAG: peptidase prolyl oligopeptidase active site domain protein [Caulobacter sp.]|nr:peptidase prolyl oligopeptidase active site domain protein [Caulobacter sp.]